MTDHKKKGDFDQWQKDDLGGDKKQDNSRQTGKDDHQNGGHGGRR